MATTPAGPDFERLVGPYRRQLHAHCYRMLGSVPDAEDALQDAMLAAWKGLPRFEGRSSLRNWLYTVATNACLRSIERRPKRVLPIDHGPPADPSDPPLQPLIESTWVDPYPDERLFVDDVVTTPEARYEQREGIELAFIVALQHLPARQRAVLILREVLGFSARETAAVIGTKASSVDSVLQRARKTVEARLPEQSQQAALGALADGELREVVDAYVRAWESADVDSVISMLVDDVTLEMPPLPNWYSGREAVVAWLGRYPLDERNRWRLVPTGANGQVGFGHYLWREEQSSYLPREISVLTLRGGRIADIAVFQEPAALARFGLPDRLRL